MSSTLFIIASIVAAAILLAAWMPRRTKKLFSGYQMARNIVFGILVVIVAPVLIGTGYGPAMLLGAAMIIIIVWTVWFGPLDEPNVSIKP